MAELEQQSIDLSNVGLEYVLSGPGGMGLARYGLPGLEGWSDEWIVPFAVYVDEQTVVSQPDCFDQIGVTVADLPDGSRHTAISLRCRSETLEIEDHTVVYAGTALVERWQTVRNVGEAAVRIDRLDTICLTIPRAAYDIMYFRSGWGQEFERRRRPLEAVSVLETRAGRSSQGAAPWFMLVRPDGQILSAAIMWSGNWKVRFESGPDGRYRVSGGLSDWEFFKSLAPGNAMESAHIAIALGANDDPDTISAQYARVGRQHWYPHVPLACSVPVEWNHWWAYEDRDLSEEAFLRNAEAAAAMGVEVCTLDAGWFGPADSGANWYAYRGDWDTVNTDRFPRGIRALSNHVHGLGMAFGLWCEIEGLGERARLAQTHSNFAATREGAPLGYVCFGNLAAREWAYATLDRLITEYAVDWIKLDFNLDPGAGCTRTDHGHGAGDGLYEHYIGLYETLERIRQSYPAIVLENCSSGGLRNDLGMLRQTHLTFLSDPDWPEHSLQVFWGALGFLAPDILLHWSFSPWLSEHPHQTFDPWDPRLTHQRLDYYVRIAMLHAFGVSQRLPDLPEWVRARMTVHIDVYKTQVRRFVRSAELHRLTDQPARKGQGYRWAVFQYSMPNQPEHLVFVFRLQGAAPEHALALQGLDSDRTYVLTWLHEDRTEQWRGSDLRAGELHIQDLAEEESALILVQHADNVERTVPRSEGGPAHVKNGD